MFALILSVSSSLAMGQASDAGDEPQAEKGQVEDVHVSALLDDDTTQDLHDDTTLLRNVSPLTDGGLLLFDVLRIWAGGAVQYDYYNFDGIFNHTDDGERREGGSLRRLEGTARAQLFDWGELKVQYDLERGEFRDLYLRWVSERPDTPVTITIGNQKEPIGMGNLYGNKFSISQERAAPVDAFGRWRSAGVRLHKAFQLAAKEDRKLDVFSNDATFVTTSIGVFRQDLENNHDTDLAVTGRVTGGRSRDGIGVHLGLSSSYREGDFERISFRPEVYEADRIVLANPSSNTMGITGLEAAYNHGRLYLQGEVLYSRMRGRVDGYGAGAYLEGGWFLTQDSRTYNPRWGILSPHRPERRLSIELFGRISHTRGDDDLSGWNDYKSVAIGSSVFYRKIKGSVSVVHGESREAIGTETDGVAVVLRAQYLF